MIFRTVLAASFRFLPTGATSFRKMQIAMEIPGASHFSSRKQDKP